MLVCKFCLILLVWDCQQYIKQKGGNINSDGKFGSFYWLGPLSLVQQNERVFFRVISFILAKYN